MKRMIVVLLSLLLLTACGQTDPAPVDKSGTDTPSVSAPEETGTPFDRFEAGLNDAGYTYETVPMAAELVGAHMGVKYKFDFGTVELYQFEDGSDALVKATQDGGLTLEGFGVVRCELNGDLAAVVSVTENEDTLLSLFNGL